MPNSHSYRAQVADIVNGQFCLKLDKKQTIAVAKKFLPKDIQIGDGLVIEFYTEKQFKARQKHLAEAVLREILGE